MSWGIMKQLDIQGSRQSLKMTICCYELINLLTQILFTYFGNLVEVSMKQDAK